MYASFALFLFVLYSHSASFATMTFECAQMFLEVHETPSFLERRSVARERLRHCPVLALDGLRAARLDAFLRLRALCNTLRRRASSSRSRR